MNRQQLKTYHNHNGRLGNRIRRERIRSGTDAPRGATGRSLRGAFLFARVARRFRRWGALVIDGFAGEKGVAKAARRVEAQAPECPSE